MSREYTPDECRQMIFDHLAGVARYVKGESRAETIEDKLELLIFCFFTMIDGESASLPAFKLVPSPHPDDREYHQEEGTNFWPDYGDLSDGELHSRWINRGREK
jgi:hypothetical protein